MKNDAPANADKPLPSLGEVRQDVWDYYDLVGFTPEGYPLSRPPLDKSKQVAHPLHGSYLILEYINQYARRKNRDDQSLAKALLVAKAAVAMMEERNGALCFYYEPGSGLTPFSTRFFSALTQARYLDVFVRLHKKLQDPWLLESAEKIFKALLIPVTDGGILLRNKWGVFLEEYPTEVPTYVLNGWITTVSEIFRYGYSVQNKEAIELAKESTRTLADLLPLYDMPEMFSTRYKLSGYVVNMLQFPRDAAVGVERIVIHSGGETYSKSPRESSRYGTLHVTSSTADKFAFKAQMSMIAYPENCRIDIHLNSRKAALVQWSVGISQYLLHYTTPKTVGHRQIKTVDIAAGKQVISADIPWDLAIGMIGAAVPFSKKVGKKYYNAYHYIHIKGLTQLYEYFKMAKLLHWRDKWLGYTEQWPSFPPYLSEDTELSAVNWKPYPTQNEYLTTPNVRLAGGLLGLAFGKQPEVTDEGDQELA